MLEKVAIVNNGLLFILKIRRIEIPKTDKTLHCLTKVVRSQKKPLKILHKTHKPNILMRSHIALHWGRIVFEYASKSPYSFMIFLKNQKVREITHCKNKILPQFGSETEKIVAIIHLIAESFLSLKAKKKKAFLQTDVATWKQFPNNYLRYYPG